MNKKNITSFVFAALLGLSATAQTTTVRVQGAPRKVSNATAAQLRRAAESSTGISFDKISRWAGEGDCRAALAIKWADGQNDGKTLVWGYRWNKGEEKTGEDLIRAVAMTDPQLYLMGGDEGYGFTIGGIGFDADADRRVSITTMEAELYPRCGVVTLPSTEFETSAATQWGDGDSWNSGWMSGFWSYYIADAADAELQMSMTGASGRTLTDGCVDAYVFGYFDTEHEANTYDGNLSYLPAATNYTGGAFIVNEDWFGHRNSTVNYLSADGTFVYDNTTDVGCTAAFGAAWGNRYYIISKQAKDSGASIEGGRITICDANTMLPISRIADIDASRANNDGRSFCGVSAHKAYVSTAKGIYVLDLDNMQVAGSIADADGNEWTSTAECGNMVLCQGRVYAMEYGKNIQVVDTATNSIAATIPAAGAYSIAMAKDGSLWVSTATGLARLNTATLELQPVTLPEGISAPANSTMGWTADGLCASTLHNAIYWTAASGWSNTKIFKYDIDANEFKPVVDLTSDPEGRSIYGCSFRVSPTTDELYITAAVGWTNNYTVRKYDADGNLAAEYPMADEAKNYWFPGMFVFPDNADPVVAAADDLSLEAGASAQLNLAALATDADNMQAAISQTIAAQPDAAVAKASIADGMLTVEGVAEGSTDMAITFCSNGIEATRTVHVTVSPATAISTAEGTAEAREAARYDISGRRIGTPVKGVNVVRLTDGTAKKVLVE